MGVWLGKSVRTDIPMHVEIGDHAAIDELGFHELARQPDAFRLVQLAGQRELDLASQLRVLADLYRLDVIPQPLEIKQMLRRAIGQHDFGMDDAGLVRKVVGAIEPFIAQPGGRAIGRGGKRAGAVCARDHLCREMVDRHDGNPSTLHKRRRHDV